MAVDRIPKKSGDLASCSNCLSLTVKNLALISVEPKPVTRLVTGGKVISIIEQNRDNATCQHVRVTQKRLWVFTIGQSVPD